MGRPSKQNPTLAVIADGEIVTWTDGLLHSTSQALEERVRYLSDIRVPLLSALNPIPILASIDDPDNRAGALVAMMNAVPGRTIVFEADEDTLCVMSNPTGQELV